MIQHPASEFKWDAGCFLVHGEMHAPRDAPRHGRRPAAGRRLSGGVQVDQVALGAGIFEDQFIECVHHAGAH